MTELLDLIFDAHGGVQRWTEASTVRATVEFRGPFWGMHGQPELLGACKVTARLDRQHITLRSALSGVVIEFDEASDRVVVSDGRGAPIETLRGPKASMHGYTDANPWSAAQTGYFVGYAVWTYLLEPYVLLLPGVTCREVQPWEELGETWRRLEVDFPPTIASHALTHTYYFDARTGLQRRIDYSPVVSAGSRAAHYTFEHRYYDGIPVPSERRVLRRDAYGVANHQQARILLDVTDFRLE